MNRTKRKKDSKKIIEGAVFCRLGKREAGNQVGASLDKKMPRKLIFNMAKIGAIESNYV